MAAAASPGSAAGYVWEDPGDSMMIQVSLELIERLGAAVQQSLGAGPRGNEIGGILLGRALPGFGHSRRRFRTDALRILTWCFLHTIPPQ